MSCPHATTRIDLTPAGPHHGKIVCIDCGRFLGWAPKPETIARQQANAREIVRLRKCGRLAPKEMAFIESVDGQGPKISPKQQTWLDALTLKYV